MKRMIVAALLCLGLAGGASRAWADTWPDRPIAIVVPFAAGGPTDVTARLISEQMGRSLGQSVVVENRPGGTTMIAAEYVARSRPDGNVLLIAAGTTLTTNPHLFRHLPYKVSDFAPVGLVTRLPFVILVRKGLPWTIPEFVTYARAHPGTLNYGTTGRGSMSHIVGAMVGEGLGIDWSDVPYRGVAPGTTEVIAGRLDVNVDAANTAVEAHRSGQAGILGWTGPERMPITPEIPTFAETTPGLVIETWFGLVAPAQTPPERIARLNAALNDALAPRALQDRLIAMGQIAAPGTPAEFATFLDRQSERYGAVIRKLDLHLD